MTPCYPTLLIRYDHAEVGGRCYNLVARKAVVLMTPPYGGLCLITGSAPRTSGRAQLDEVMIELDDGCAESPVVFNTEAGRFEADLEDALVRFDRLDDLTEAYAASDWQVVYLARLKTAADGGHAGVPEVEETLIDAIDYGEDGGDDP